MNKLKLISKLLLILFLFLSLNTRPVKGEQIIRLAGYFIDKSEGPVIIYDEIYPESIIQQNNMVYAPAQSFLKILGVTNELQNLPDQLVINNYLAPTSLLAIGPDRYTNEPIYYLKTLQIH